MHISLMSNLIFVKTVQSNDCHYCLLVNKKKKLRKAILKIQPLVSIALCWWSTDPKHSGLAAH